MFGRIKDKARYALLIAVIMMLVSMIGTSFIQSGGGTVTVKTLTLESISGHTMSAKLFIPKSATAENPAPVVVYAHGWYNNKENGDLFAVEYSRRGYVVFTYDMYSHGNSEDLDNVAVWDGGNGMYDAAAYVATLPYVDKDKIVISGHSAGANACSKAVVIDNENETNLIKACLLIAYDPVIMEADENNTDTFGVSTSSGTYNNIYGNRDVALIAGQYDDYFFTVKENSKPVTATREYLSTTMAKAFVSFGNGPQAFSEEKVEEGKFYTQTVGERQAVRVIYNPSAIHAQCWLSTAVVNDGITFLEQIFPTQTTLTPNEQIWPLKAALGALGLAGFWIFLAAFAIELLNTRVFEGLKRPVEMRQNADGKDRIWALGTSAVKIGASAFIFWQIMHSTMYSRIDPVWQQKNTFCIAGWAALNALVIIATVAAWYYGYAKKRGVDLREAGLILPRKNILKTVAIAIVTIVGAWSIVFFADYFFQTDFRFWQWSAKAFPAAKILPTLTFLPLFLLFFVANSVAINVQGYSNALGKKEWVNMLVLGLLNCLAPLIFIVIQYTMFVSTGFQMWGTGAEARIPTWLHTAVLILFITPYIARAIYKRTRNPYIGGIVNGMLVTLCLCMNSTTLTGTGL